MRVGFIGTGHIAAPMARAAAGRGHDVLVSERNRATSAALAAGSERIAVAPNQRVLDGSEVVFLCVRPPLAAEVIGPLAFRPDHRVISVMAGVAMADLRGLCAPAREVAATIPLGFVEAGGCPLAVHPGSDDLGALFGATNPVIAVADEGAFHRHFAVCAMVPGVLDLLDTAAGWLGGATGDRGSAEIYTTQLLRGFLAAGEPRAGGLAAERDALATAGTISLRMVEALRDGGAHEVLRGALEAIAARAEARG